MFSCESIVNKSLCTYENGVVLDKGIVYMLGHTNVAFIRPKVVRERGNVYTLEHENENLRRLSFGHMYLLISAEV